MVTSDFRSEVEIRPFRHASGHNYRNSSFINYGRGYGADTTFHRTYFQLLLLLRCPDCTQTPRGEEYLGTVNTTVNGHTCQAWTSDFPHERTGNSRLAAYYPDVSIEAAENYCRNPSRDPLGIWCYTTNPDVNWEMCDLPLCSAPHGRSTLSISSCLTFQRKQKVRKGAKWCRK